MDKRKCIVLSPPIYQGRAIADGFRACGWEPIHLTFHAEPRRSATNPRVWLDRARGRQTDGRRFDEVLWQEALPMARDEGARLIVVVRPDEFGERSEEALARNRVPIVTWVIDSLSRVPSENSLTRFSTADFFLDGGDAVQPKGRWLPLGVDSSLLPSAPIPKETDILFIGNVQKPYYNGRYERLLELLGSNLPKRYRVKAIICGPSRLGFERIRWTAPCPILHSVGIREYSKEIAAARICVNVMPSDGESPINDGFMLVPALGTCQVTDLREYLASWLTPGEQFVWFGQGEMIRRLEELLESPEVLKRITAEGARETVARHTYAARVQTLAAAAGL